MKKIFIIACLILVLFGLWQIKTIVFAETSGSSPESGAGSRIKTSYDWLVAKGVNYGATDVADWTNDWGTWWNRIMEAAAWEPDGTATAGTVLSAYTFYAGNGDRTIKTGTYDASSLSTATVKKGTAFGVGLTGAYSGYAGTGWSGTAITQAACDAQNGSGWYWFADGNGDGDTTDAEDGLCVLASAVSSSSWNGAEQIAASNITAQAATAGSANSITKGSAGWTANAYANMVVKITSGTASGCWGVAKSNTTNTITVYGSWLSSAYASNCGTPDATSVFTVAGDGFDWYDNSWIGDWTCTGSFPSGAAKLGFISYLGSSGCRSCSAGYNGLL